MEANRTKEITAEEKQAFARERAEQRRKYVRTFFSRKSAYVALFIVLAFLLTAIFANLIAPYDPNLNNLMESSQGPSAKHLLGTDMHGRDILSRLIYGARISLSVGVATVFIGAVIGGMLGLVSGYFGGIVDDVIMRLCEAIRAIPLVVLASALMLVFGGGVGSLIIILSFGSTMQFVRVMRGQVLQTKAADYIMARRVTGCSDFRIMVRHVLPNAISPMLVLMTQSIGGSILAESGLSFLNIGITPPTATWGSMINDGRQFLFSNPVVAIAPGVCIILLVVSLSILGDALRDTLDPRLRGIM